MIALLSMYHISMWWRDPSFLSGTRRVITVVVPMPHHWDNTTESVIEQTVRQFQTEASCKSPYVRAWMIVQYRAAFKLKCPILRIINSMRGRRFVVMVCGYWNATTKSVLMSTLESLLRLFIFPRQLRQTHPAGKRVAKTRKVRVFCFCHTRRNGCFIFWRGASQHTKFETFQKI